VSLRDVFLKTVLCSCLPCNSGCWNCHCKTD